MKIQIQIGSIQACYVLLGTAAPASADRPGTLTVHDYGAARVVAVLESRCTEQERAYGDRGSFRDIPHLTERDIEETLFWRFRSPVRP